MDQPLSLLINRDPPRNLGSFLLCTSSDSRLGVSGTFNLLATLWVRSNVLILSGHLSRLL